jgi:hypothetical protein
MSPEVVIGFDRDAAAHFTPAALAESAVRTCPSVPIARFDGVDTPVDARIEPFAVYADFDTLASSWV